MSGTFSMNGGSDNLKLSARCGLSPKARQIRLTADWDMPVAAAIERVDQWVAPSERSFQGLHNHNFDVVVGDRSRCPRARLVMEALQTVLSEARPPLGHRVTAEAKPACDLGITSSARTSQHDPATPSQRPGSLDGAPIVPACRARCRSR
jgi:hypothetical protein